MECVGIGRRRGIIDAERVRVLRRLKRAIH
jgi:hypothetical protein